MGRPLNKRFFGDGAGLIACSADIGAGAEACFITEQRSNTAYRVDSEAGPSTRTGVCRIVAGAPALNEMRVEVQAENAVTPVEATFTFGTDATVNNATVIAIDIVTGGYGYWAGGTFNISIASDAGYEAGTEAEITYTVANGVIVSANITGAGAGYTEDLVATAVNTADIPDEAADPPLEYARIINARQVKTFEGNTFDWPITAPLGTPVLNGLTQADLGTQ